MPLISEKEGMWKSATICLYVIKATIKFHHYAIIKKKNLKEVVSVTTEFVQVQALKKLKFGSYLAL